MFYKDQAQKDTKSLICARGRLTRVGLEGGGLALDSGGRVGCVSILVGGIKTAASDCLPVGMSSALSPPSASVRFPVHA